MGSNTLYSPGSVRTAVTGSPVNIPGLTMPGSGGPSLPGLPDLSGVLNQRLAIEAEREKRAAALQALQMEAMRGALGDAERARMEPRFNTAESDRSAAARARSLQHAAAQNAAFRDNEQTYGRMENYMRDEVNQQGVPISVMDQSKVPTYLQGRFQSGIYSRPGFGYVPGQQQYQVGLQRQGGQTGGSMSPVGASIGPGGEGNVTPPPDERSDWYGLRARQQAEAMAMMGRR